jgi:molecular chaperone GrpE
MAKKKKYKAPDLKDLKVVPIESMEIGLDLTVVNSTEFVLEDNPRAHVSVLEEQLKEANDKYMLLYADFENYKRRTQKEKEELKSNTKVAMITSILDMDSDIELAIKNIKDDAAREGVELIASKVQKFLKSQGIEPIQTETYDEDLHEVISVLEIGESKILDVASKGYTLNGKPFRFPKIVLGK